MDEFGLQRAEEALGGGVVETVSLPAGGFKRSSQHLDGGGCDEYSKTAFGSVRARRITLAWPARGGAA
jgi:hypothetical protein